MIFVQGHRTVKGEIRLALTSGYSLDVRICLPEPHRLLCLPFFMVPVSLFSSASIVPCTWRPVLYLSVKRLVMMQRQENPKPLALNASMAFAWSSRPRSHDKCQVPVNKIEHCQSHSVLASQAECSACLRVQSCVTAESQVCTKTNISWISLI